MQSMGKFKPGQSGNPGGKAPGTKSRTTLLRESLADHLPDILDRLVEQANAGDLQAIKVLLDRVMPALRPIDSPVRLSLGEDLGANGRAILAAAASSEITPDQAAKLLQGVGALARVIEIDELAKRVAALEERNVGT
jgi:hypothetical protein